MSALPEHTVKYRKRMYILFWVFLFAAALNALSFTLNVTRGSLLWILSAGVFVFCIYEAVDCYKKSARSKRISAHNVKVIRRAFVDAQMCYWLAMNGSEYAGYFTGKGTPLKDSELYHRAWSHAFKREDERYS